MLEIKSNKIATQLNSKYSWKLHVISTNKNK